MAGLFSEQARFVCFAPAASATAPSYKITYGGDTYLGISLGFDGTDFLSDQTRRDDWLNDHKKQFKILFGKLDVPVVRKG